MAGPHSAPPRLLLHESKALISKWDMDEEQTCTRSTRHTGLGRMPAALLSPSAYIFEKEMRS